MTSTLPEPRPNDVVILSAARTPLGKVTGALASQTAVQLGTVALRKAIEQSGLAASDIDTVIFGQVLQAGAGQNPARQTAIGAGIGWDVPATTINKVCLSGLAAVIDAARLIRAGEATVVAAGGQESMTNAPHILPGSRKGWVRRLGDDRIALSKRRPTEARRGNDETGLSQEFTAGSHGSLLDFVPRHLP